MGGDDDERGVDDPVPAARVGGTARPGAVGRYAILVHYYSANAGVSTWPTKTAEATVRVYLYGLLAAELKQPLALDGDLWTAGTLNWPERTITPSQSVLGAQTCAMF